MQILNFSHFSGIKERKGQSSSCSQVAPGKIGRETKDGT
jgi:hypothetical protein